MLSVVICTHTPRPDYLARVILALKVQSLSSELWELLLVDNASEEPLKNQVDLTWHKNARHIREEELGLTPARLRGISESRGDLVVFVDDDNLLQADYLEKASVVSVEWPRLGAWGGTCKPEFEQAPSPELAGRVDCLALRTVERETWANFAGSDYKAVPVGAGMCVRRLVAELYMKEARASARRFSLDRKGASLVSGGDTDLALTAHDLGLGTGLFPQLVLTHLIPAQRVQSEYLLKLCEALAYSEYRLRLLREPTARGEFTFWSEAKNQLKLLFMNEVDRGFAAAYRRGRKKAEAELVRKG